LSSILFKYHSSRWINIAKLIIQVRNENYFSAQRKYSDKETFELPFTLTADDTTASFKTWDQMSSWVKYYKSGHRKVTIRGHHKVSSFSNQKLLRNLQSKFLVSLGNPRDFQKIFKQNENPKRLWEE